MCLKAQPQRLLSLAGVLLYPQGRKVSGAGTHTTAVRKVMPSLSEKQPGPAWEHVQSSWFGALD